MLNLMEMHQLWSPFTANIPTFCKELPLAIIYAHYAN